MLVRLPIPYRAPWVLRGHGSMADPLSHERRHPGRSTGCSVPRWLGRADEDQLPKRRSRCRRTKAQARHGGHLGSRGTWIASYGTSRRAWPVGPRFACLIATSCPKAWRSAAVAFREVGVVEVREVLRGWLEGAGLRTVAGRSGWTARPPGGTSRPRSRRVCAGRRGPRR